MLSEHFKMMISRARKVMGNFSNIKSSIVHNIQFSNYAQLERIDSELLNY